MADMIWVKNNGVQRLVKVRIPGEGGSYTVIEQLFRAEKVDPATGAVIFNGYTPVEKDFHAKLLAGSPIYKAEIDSGRMQVFEVEPDDAVSSEQRVGILTGKLATANAKIDELTGQLEAANASIASLKESVNTANAKIDELEKKIANGEFDSKSGE